MPHLSWLEWFGYAASVVVAVSLMMSSLLKLRWYNLLGAALFSAYGFLIHAYPVAVLNGFIACADIYYLVRMYSAKERFTIVAISPKSEYLACFLQEYRADILRFFPNFNFHLDEHRIGFYVLRNLVPASVFIGNPTEEGTLEVELDFAVPAYRDFKPGAFLFRQNQALFQTRGFTRFLARSHDKEHDRYLQKMGFRPTGKEGDGSVYSLEIGS